MQRIFDRRTQRTLGLIDKRVRAIEAPGEGYENLDFGR